LDLELMLMLMLMLMPMPMPMHAHVRWPIAKDGISRFIITSFLSE
jgi:hypothetical protein